MSRETVNHRKEEESVADLGVHVQKKKGEGKFGGRAE